MLNGLTHNGRLADSTAGMADGPQLAILEQADHGVAIRMAVMERALLQGAQRSDEG